MSSHGYSTTASAPALSGLLPRSERGGGLSHCLPYESATTPVGSLDRAELQVQLGQPPHLPGGLVGVAACVGWAVRTLRNRDVGHPVEYPVEGNASLGPGEWRSRTGVVATSERQMLANVGAVHAELVGLLELARVPIAGAGQQHHRGSRRNRYVTDRGRCACHAEVGLHRALHPQCLFDEGGDAVAFPAQQRLDVRTFSD